MVMKNAGESQESEKKQHQDIELQFNSKCPNSPKHVKDVVILVFRIPGVFIKLQLGKTTDDPCSLCRSCICPSMVGTLSRTWRGVSDPRNAPQKLESLHQEFLLVPKMEEKQWSPCFRLFQAGFSISISRIHTAKKHGEDSSIFFSAGNVGK